jgi:hypothetical protein
MKRYIGIVHDSMTTKGNFGSIWVEQLDGSYKSENTVLSKEAIYFDLRNNYLKEIKEIKYDKNKNKNI